MLDKVDHALMLCSPLALSEVGAHTSSCPITTDNWIDQALSGSNQQIEVRDMSLFPFHSQPYVALSDHAPIECYVVAEGNRLLSHCCLQKDHDEEEKRAADAVVVKKGNVILADGLVSTHVQRWRRQVMETLNASRKSHCLAPSASNTQAMP